MKKKKLKENFFKSLLTGRLVKSGKELHVRYCNREGSLSYSLGMEDTAIERVVFPTVLPWRIL